VEGTYTGKADCVTGEAGEVRLTKEEAQK
jgi:hypothetical protein